MLVNVDVPDFMAQSLGSTDASRSRRILEALMLDQYRAGEISGGCLGETLGMSFHEREQFLHDHQAFQPITPEEYAKDAENLVNLLAK